MSEHCTRELFEELVKLIGEIEGETVGPEGFVAFVERRFFVMPWQSKRVRSVREVVPAKLARLRELAGLLSAESGEVAHEAPAKEPCKCDDAVYPVRDGESLSQYARRVGLPEDALLQRRSVTVYEVADVDEAADAALEAIERGTLDASGEPAVSRATAEQLGDHVALAWDRAYGRKAASAQPFGWELMGDAPSELPQVEAAPVAPVAQVLPELPQVEAPRPMVQRQPLGVLRIRKPRADGTMRADLSDGRTATVAPSFNGTGEHGYFAEMDGTDLVGKWRDTPELALSDLLARDRKAKRAAAAAPADTSFDFGANVEPPAPPPPPPPPAPPPPPPAPVEPSDAAEPFVDPSELNDDSFDFGANVAPRCNPTTVLSSDALDLDAKAACAPPDARKSIAKAKTAVEESFDADDTNDYEANKGLCTAPCTTPATPNCNRRITSRMIREMASGELPNDGRHFDTTAAHKYGAHKLCYYSAAMIARRKLEEITRRTADVPENIIARGDSAVERYLRNAVDAAERASKFWDEWRENDARIAAKIEGSSGQLTGNDVEDLKEALRAFNDGRAYFAQALADRFNVLDNEGEPSESGIADELVRAAIEENHRSSEKGREAREAAIKSRVRKEGTLSAAYWLAGMGDKRSNAAAASAAPKAEPTPKPKATTVQLIDYTRLTRANDGAWEKRISAIPDDVKARGAYVATPKIVIDFSAFPNPKSAAKLIARVGKDFNEADAMPVSRVAAFVAKVAAAPAELLQTLPDVNPEPLAFKADGTRYILFPSTTDSTKRTLVKADLFTFVRGFLTGRRLLWTAVRLPNADPAKSWAGMVARSEKDPEHIVAMVSTADITLDADAMQTLIAQRMAGTFADP